MTSAKPKISQTNEILDHHSQFYDLKNTQKKVPISTKKMIKPITGRASSELLSSIMRGSVYRAHGLTQFQHWDGSYQKVGRQTTFVTAEQLKDLSGPPLTKVPSDKSISKIETVEDVKDDEPTIRMFEAHQKKRAPKSRQMNRMKVEIGQRGSNEDLKFDHRAYQSRPGTQQGYPSMPISRSGFPIQATKPYREQSNDDFMNNGGQSTPIDPRAQLLAVSKDSESFRFHKRPIGTAENNGSMRKMKVLKTQKSTEFGRSVKTNATFDNTSKQSLQRKSANAISAYSCYGSTIEISRPQTRDANMVSLQNARMRPSFARKPDIKMHETPLNKSSSSQIQRRGQLNVLPTRSEIKRNMPLEDKYRSVKTTIDYSYFERNSSNSKKKISHTQNISDQESLALKFDEIKRLNSIEHRKSEQSSPDRESVERMLQQSRNSSLEQANNNRTSPEVFQKKARDHIFKLKQSWMKHVESMPKKKSPGPGDYNNMIPTKLSTHENLAAYSFGTNARSMHHQLEQMRMQNAKPLKQGQSKKLKDVQWAPIRQMSQSRKAHHRHWVQTINSEREQKSHSPQKAPQYTMGGGIRSTVLDWDPKVVQDQPKIKTILNKRL